MATRADTIRRGLAHALASSPGLGAFTVALGMLGLEGAVRLCKTRKPSKALRLAWAELSYSLEQLPSAEDIRLFIVGVEVHQALYSARHNDPTIPFATVVKPLGHAQCDVILGLRLVRRAYAADPSVKYEELGAI